jgi:hypothetical protein
VSNLLTAILLAFVAALFLHQAAISLDPAIKGIFYFLVLFGISPLGMYFVEEFLKDGEVGKE